MTPVRTKAPASTKRMRLSVSVWRDIPAHCVRLTSMNVIVAHVKMEPGNELKETMFHCF